MARSPASLGQELNQLREALENAYYRQRTVEQRLRDALRAAGKGALRIEVFDVIGANSKKPDVVTARCPEPPAEIWPRARKAGRPMRPTPGLANLTVTDAKTPVVGVSVCGFEPAQLDQIIGMIAERQLVDQDFVPVFLTDSMHAGLFRKHRYTFEYFPMKKSDRRLPGTADWADYAARRLEMIRRKYGLVRILTFGRLPFCQS